MRARHVGEAAVGDVLQAAGHAGRPVILHVGDVDDLRQPARHQPHDVRPRVLFAEEIRLEVGGRIVAAVVDVPVGALGRDDLDALWQVRRVVALVHLVLKPLVHVDLRHRDADARQLAHDFGHDLVRGDAVRIAAAVDLDADDVRRFEEAPPGVSRRAGARQRAHALRHHLAHDRVVCLAGRGVDGFGRLDRHHAARIRARHPGSRRRRVARDDTKRRNVLGLLDGSSERIPSRQRRWRARMMSWRKWPPPAGGRTISDAWANLPPSHFHLRKSELRFILHE